MHAHRVEAPPAAADPKASRRENTRFSRHPAPRNHEVKTKEGKWPREFSRGHFYVGDVDKESSGTRWLTREDRAMMLFPRDKGSGMSKNYHGAMALVSDAKRRGLLA